MFAALRRWFASALSAELGVLGARVDALEAALEALVDAQAALKTRFERVQKSRAFQGNGGDVEALMALLQARGGIPKSNPDFPE